MRNKKIIQKFNSMFCAYKYQKLINSKYIEIESISTHLSDAEKFKIYQLATSKDGVFVEIGSYLGASASLIALACSENNRDAKLFCVDTWENDTMSEGPQDTFKAFIDNTKRFERFIIPLKGRSVDIAADFGQKIDFLFIDGDHSYEGVRNDVQAWLPKLNAGALVILHDIGWAEGVQRVVREMVASRAKAEDQLPNLYWAWL